ncbi:6-phosphogluconolactonase [Leucobacter sp. USHLN153]|uniref:6-phosphogluconolactonase n=1 Tax=Leucobacter sp. USHLN153 TaxID=3081268 RepID=UPI00301A8FE2
MRIEERADLRELATAIAGAAISVCRERQAGGGVALASDGIPCVVLTGGGGGAAVLEALAEHPDRDTVDWTRVRFIWGDERWVPAGHEDRNDLLADRSLFAVVQTDPALVHRVPASDSGLSLDEAAAEYAAVIDGIERIDLAFNGVGPDGHVASLFPGRDELAAVGADTPAALPIRNSPKPPPERVTLTMPVLCRAERAWAIAAGEGKADAVAGLLEPGETPLPIARVRGSRETVLWADTAALARV